MAVTHYTLTATFTDLLGTAYNSNGAAVVAWLETNVADNQGVVDDVSNLIAVGPQRKTADASGTVVFANVIGSDSAAADINIADGTLQYRVTAEYINALTRKRGQRWSSGWFSLTANTNLADVVAEQYIPATYITQATEALDAHAAELEADITAAVGDLSGYVDDASGYASDAAASAALAHDISGISTPDGVVEALIIDAGSDTSAALSASYASTATSAAFAKVTRKIQRGQDDVNITVIGDSTGNASDEWVRLWLPLWAAYFPTHTVIYHLWNTTTDTGYDGTGNTAVTIQTGSGSRTIHLWNFAISGTPSDYIQGVRWQAGYVDTNPDLTVVSHGHNEGPSSGGVVPDQWRTRMFVLTESCRAAIPQTALVLIFQNPETANNDQAKRAQVYDEVAQVIGAGTIDVHQAFVDTGNVAGYTKVDGVHPTTASDAPAPNGSLLWASTVLAASQPTGAKLNAPTQPASSLLGGGSECVYNPNFSSFSGAVPDGWTVAGCTTTKDVRAGYSKNTTGYGVRVQATGAAQSRMEQLVPDFAQFKGEYVTLLVRMRIPTGQTASAGRIALSDGVTTITSIASTAAQGGLIWRAVTLKVSTSASYLKLTIYGDSAASSGADITVSEPHLVRGIVPRASTPGTPGAAGATGAASNVAVDHLSTLSTNPVVTAAISNTATTFSVANNAILVPIKPARNMSLAKLGWLSRAQSGNYDIGIYSAAGTRLWSKGSTAWPAGATTWVDETVSPPVALVAGTTYWVAIAGDNTTGSFQAATVSAAGSEFLKLIDGTPHARTVGTSFPLPSTITLGSTTSSKIPAVILKEA